MRFWPVGTVYRSAGGKRPASTRHVQESLNDAGKEGGTGHANRSVRRGSAVFGAQCPELGTNEEGAGGVRHE